MHIIADYHTHTRFSHGTGTIEENVIEARKKGLKTIGISEHGPANLFGVGVKNSSVLHKIREEINDLNEKYEDIDVLFGVEANIVGLNGEIDVDETVLNRLDYLLVGLHLLVNYKTHCQTLKMIIGNMLLSPLGIYDEKFRKINTTAVISAVQKYDVFAVTHPGLRLNIDTNALAKVCKQNNTALEINSGHKRITVDFIEESKKEGIKYVFGSDAHRPCDVGNMKNGMHLAELAHLSPDHIINAE